MLQIPHNFPSNPQGYPGLGASGLICCARTMTYGEPRRGCDDESSFAQNGWEWLKRRKCVHLAARLRDCTSTNPVLFRTCLYMQLCV